MSVNKPIKTGERFGRLVALSVDKTFGGLRYWLCRCDCGTSKVIVGVSLRRGHTKSCGCLSIERLRSRRKTHGRSNTSTYACWQNMRARCTDLSRESFRNYGARGIKVCERWESFDDFFADMGEMPRGHSLERTNNSGNYEPGNCVWATRKTQNRNTRRTLLVSFEGSTKSLAEWADEMGCKYMTLYNRIKVYEWTLEESLGTPIGTRRKR